LTKKSSFFSRFKKAITRQKGTTGEISDKVISSLEEQLKLTPNNFRLRLKLADTYLALGKREKALDEYCKSAHLYLEHDFTPLAVATYKKILNEDPQHLEANLELGRIYRQKKFFADATSYFHKAFDYYFENALNDKALRTLETIIEIAPDKEPYRLLLEQRFPDHQENAKSIYSDLIVTHKKSSPQPPQPPEESDDANFFFDLGTELGDEIEEIEDYSASDTGSDNTEEDFHEHGVEDIFQALKSNISEGKDNADTDTDKFHYNLALAYNELKMPEQALLESEESLKSATFRLQTLILRSHIYLSQGAAPTALSQIQQGLLEKGLTRQDFVTLKLQLGLILKEMEHFPQALEALHEAHALDPENVEIAHEIESLEELTS